MNDARGENRKAKGSDVKQRRQRIEEGGDGDMTVGRSVSRHYDGSR